VLQRCYTVLTLLHYTNAATAATVYIASSVTVHITTLLHCANSTLLHFSSDDEPKKPVPPAPPAMVTLVGEGAEGPVPEVAEGPVPEAAEGPVPEAAEGPVPEAAAKWGRCRRTLIPRELQVRLHNAIKNSSDIGCANFTPPLYNEFVERIAREYHYQWTESGSDQLHLQRERTIRECIATTSRQLKPRTLIPDVPKMLVVIQPLLEVTFTMPSCAPKGSAKWIAKKIKQAAYSVKECVRYPTLRKAWISHMIRNHCDDKGFPKLAEGLYTNSATAHASTLLHCPNSATAHAPTLLHCVL
jgi:hypothetical protein